jgi:hypothetical protein
MSDGYAGDPGSDHDHIGVTTQRQSSRNSLILDAIAPGVNPNFSARTLSGAEAPK